MTDVLSRIINTKHEELAALRSRHGKADLDAMIADQAPPRDFTAPCAVPQITAMA